MKKLCMLSLAVLFVTAVFAVPEAQAGCRYRCLGNYSSSPGGGQPSDWGMGSSCVAAEADFDAHLWATANDLCYSMGHVDGACSVTKVTTTACYFNTDINMYQVDGYSLYKCSVEICIDPVQ